jgi:hypothetical protein
MLDRGIDGTADCREAEMVAHILDGRRVEVDPGNVVLS